MEDFHDQNKDPNIWGIKSGICKVDEEVHEDNVEESCKEELTSVPVEGFKSAAEHFEVFVVFGFFLFADEVLTFKQDDHDTDDNEGDTHAASTEILHLAGVVVFGGNFEDIVEDDARGSRALCGFVIEYELEYFAVHDNADNDDNDDLKCEGHEGTLDDFIDDSQVHLDLDGFSFLGYKIVINPHEQILDIPDYPYNHEHDHIHIPLKPEVEHDVSVVERVWDNL